MGRPWHRSVGRVSAAREVLQLAQIEGILLVGVGRQGRQNVEGGV